MNKSNSVAADDSMDDSSVSTEVVKDSQGQEYLDQDNQSFDSTKKISKKRFFGDSRIRSILFILIIIGLFLLFFFLFFGTGSKEKLNQGEVSIAVPDTKLGDSNNIPEEYKEYYLNKQIQQAQQAQNNGESFIPEFKNIVSDNKKIESNQDPFSGQSFLGNGNNQQQGADISLELSRMAQNNMRNQNQSSLPANTNQSQQNTAQQSQVQDQQATQYESQLGSYYQTAQNSHNEVAQYYASSNQVNSSSNNQTNADLSKLFDDQFARQVSLIQNKDRKSTYKTTYYSEPQSQVVESTSTKTIDGNLKASSNGDVVIKAGTRMKAQLTKQVNTDRGNDVYAKVIGGKFGGAELLGTVSPQRDDVQINIQRMLFKGKDYKIAVKAMPLSSGRMADSIQKHTMKKLGALVLSSGLDGYGQAYSNLGQAQISNSGTVVVDKAEPNDKEIAGNVVGSIGSELSNLVNNTANRETTYILNTGKVFEIFFDADVKQPE